jgi:hypothetical protein
MMRRILAAGLLVAASAVQAQSIFDVGVRVAPQFHSYDIKSPSNTKISESAVPMFVVLPINAAFSFDIGTSYARSEVTQTTNGQKTTSTISGLTDTQVRANYTLGNDMIVLTAGVNLPTGQSSVKQEQLLAAGLIGSDFLAFPISNMGTGFGGTGGVAFARPVGEWNVGLGVSMRQSSAYEPLEAPGAITPRYQPGNEYRVRGGIDHVFGTGRVNLGLTYSTFGNDNLDGSIYNTGNRWITQAGLTNNYGPGTVVLTAWNLFREAGTLADGSLIGHENIANAALSYGVVVAGTTIEPNIEGRIWTQSGGLPTSGFTTLGVRSQLTFRGFTMLPSVGYSLGKLAAQDQGVNTTATLTGLHGILAIRLR